MKTSSKLTGAINYSIEGKKRSFIGILNYFPLTTPQFRPLQHFFFNFSNLQYVVILVYFEMATLNPSPTTGLTFYIQKLAQILSLCDAFQSNFANEIYMIFLICSWIYLLIFLFIIALLGIKTIKQVVLIPISRSFLDIFFQSHLAVFFWIINMILIVPLSIKSKDQVSTLGLNNNDPILIIVNALAFGLNNIIGFTLSVFCSEPLKGHRIYAAHTSASQIALFLSKAILTIFVFLIEKDNEVFGIVVGVLGLVLSVIQLSILIRNMPFFNSGAAKCAMSWNFAAIWISVVHILVIALFRNETIANKNGVVYIKILLLPFAVRLAIAIFNTLSKSYMTTKMDSLTSETRVFKKLLGFSILSQKMKISMNIETELNEYEAYFLGDLSEHSKGCKDHDCICHMLSDELSPDLRKVKNIKERMEAYKDKRAGEILSSGIERIRKNHKLKIAYANLILQGEGDNLKLNSALMYLYSIQADSFLSVKFSINTKKKILLKIVEDKIDKFFNSKQEGVLNLKIYIDFHVAQNNFKYIMLSNTKKYLDFWSYYQEPKFRMLTLYKKSEAMEEESVKLESMWNSYMAKYPYFYSIMGEYYVLYEKLVRNLPFYANKTLRKYAWKLKGVGNESQNLPMITEANLTLPDTMAFYVSMTKERLGKILYVSSNIENILGYSQEDLIGKSINTLMPASLITYHDKALRKHIQQSKSLDSKSVIHIPGYVKSQNGHLLPMSIYVTIFPYVQKELTYMAVLRVKETPYEHILVTEYGAVDGFTEKIGRELCLNAENSLKVSDICPDIGLPETKKTAKLVNLVFDVLSEEMIDQGGTSILKKKTGFNQSAFNRDDFQDEDTETAWKSFRMFKQHKRGRYEEAKKRQVKNFLLYEIKVVSMTYLKKKYHILLIRPEENAYSRTSLQDFEVMKASTEVREYDYDSNVPLERPELMLDLMSPKRRLHGSIESSPILPDLLPLNSEGFQAETEAALLSATSQTKLFQKAILNPNPKSNAFSEIFQSIKIETVNSPKEILHNTTEGNLFSPKVPPLNIQENRNKNQPKDHDSFNIEDNEEREHVKLSEKASSVVSGSGRPRIEQAVYAIPKVTLARNIFVLVGLLLILCIALLVVIVIHGKDILVLIQGNINILSLSTSRLGEFLFLQRYGELISCLREGLIEDNRFEGVFGASIQDSLPYSLIEDANYLRYLNREVRNALEGTAHSLQKEINQLMVPLEYEDGSKVIKNNFDAANEMVMRSFAISATPSVFTEDDINVDFLMKNQVNELLVTSETMMNIIIQDNTLKLNNLQILSLSFLLAIFVLGAILLAMLAHQQRLFMRNRDRFIDLLCRIDEYELILNMNRIKIFETLLSQNSTQFDRLISQNTTRRSKVGINITKQQQQKKISRKDTNMAKINRNQFFIFTLGLLLFLVFLSPFIHVFDEVINNTDVIKSKIASFVTASFGLYEILLLSVSFTQYLRTNGNSIVRNEPINDNWTKLFKKRSDAQGDLINLLIYYQKEKICTDDTIQTLESLIRGDLCEAPPLAMFADLCYSLRPSLLAEGIQGLNSFSLYTLYTLKQEFDSSARTYQDAKDIFAQKELIELDLMIASFQSVGYIILGETLQDCAYESIDDTKLSLTSFLKAYIPLVLIFSPLLLIFILKRVSKERIGWKKVFRKIPIDMIRNSKVLKHYLSKESGYAIRI